MVDYFNYNNFILKNYIDLDKNENKMVLSWRNDKRVSIYLHEQKKITFTNHLKFIENLKYSNDKKYWLIKNSNKNIGVISLYNIKSKSTSFGSFLNPELIGKSYGLLTEKLILHIIFDYYNFEIAYSELKENNNNSYKISILFGFEELFLKNKIKYMYITNNTWQNNKNKFQYIDNFFNRKY